MSVIGGFGVRRGRAFLRPGRLAYAHSGSHSYLFVEVADGSIKGNMQFPIADLNEVMDLSIPPDESGALASIGAHRSAIEAYATSHFTIGTPGKDWTVNFAGVRVLERSGWSYAIFDYSVSDVPRPIPRHFTVVCDAIIHAKPDHQALVIVKTETGFGQMRTVSEQRLPASSDSTTHRIEIGSASSIANFIGALRAATKRIREPLGRIKRRVLK